MAAVAAASGCCHGCGMLTLARDVRCGTLTPSSTTVSMDICGEKGGHVGVVLAVFGGRRVISAGVTGKGCSNSRASQLPVSAQRRRCLWLDPASY
jgi:hypothetical protein